MSDEPVERLDLLPALVKYLDHSGQLVNIQTALEAVTQAQGCHRVLVSLFSWPGQLLSLFPCQRLKFLARMLFLGILSLTVVKCRKEEGKDKDEIVLLKQNEISSLIMEAATLKKYIWSCFGQTAPAGCE